LALQYSDVEYRAGGAIRMSNTEPVVRLNVESRGDRDLMKKKTAEILAVLES